MDFNIDQAENEDDEGQDLNEKFVMTYDYGESTPWIDVTVMS